MSTKAGMLSMARVEWGGCAAAAATASRSALPAASTTTRRRTPACASGLPGAPARLVDQALGGVEEHHAPEHRGDEDRGLFHARAEGDQRRPGAEPGKSPADAEDHASADESPADVAALRQVLAPARKGRARRRASVKAKNPTRIAPAMTNASDGSQLPKTSRNPMTLP